MTVWWLTYEHPPENVTNWDQVAHRFLLFQLVINIRMLTVTSVGGLIGRVSASSAGGRGFNTEDLTN